MRARRAPVRGAERPDLPGRGRADAARRPLRRRCARRSRPGEARPLTRALGLRAAPSSTQAILHIPDLLAETDREYPDIAAAIRREGIRTTIGDPAPARGRADRLDHRVPHGGPALHRQADRAAPDLRRPGGHRDRERAAVQGAGGEATGRSPRRSSSRPPPARSCASSAARRPTCSRSSTRSCRAPCGSAARHSAHVLRVVGDELHLAAVTSISETADAESRGHVPDRRWRAAGVASAA